MMPGKVILHHVNTLSKGEQKEVKEGLMLCVGVVVVFVGIISISLLIQILNKNLSFFIHPCTLHKAAMGYTGDDDDDEYDELCLYNMCEKLVDGFIIGVVVFHFAPNMLCGGDCC
jgi:hypothetical protein